jgi:hypothetical protein
VVSRFLTHSSGDTATQILRMLPKLKVLRKEEHPICFSELSAVSSGLISLVCMSGFDIATSQNDLHALVFPQLEKAVLWSRSDSQLYDFVGFLENCQGRGCLKILVVIKDREEETRDEPPLDNSRLRSSLVRVIEVPSG